jgi:hypothetical protein
VDGRARAVREEGIAIIGRLVFLVDATKTFCGIAFVNETEKFGQIDRTSGRSLRSWATTPFTSRGRQPRILGAIRRCA